MFWTFLRILSIYKIKNIAKNPHNSDYSIHKNDMLYADFIGCRQRMPNIEFNFKHYNSTKTKVIFLFFQLMNIILSKNERQIIIECKRQENLYLFLS